MKNFKSNLIKTSLFTLAIIANVFFTGGQLFAQNAKIKSILFIGNSYTAVNDLPNWVRLIGESQGDTFEAIGYTPGGRTFYGHSTDPQVTNLFQQKNYDVVVLQEQSQLPSFPLSQVESDCYPYAKTLVDSVRANNPFAKIVFYSTWGRQNGDAQNCVNWPPVCSFKGMNQLLHDRYIQMGVDNYAWVAPVNSVWKAIRDSSQMNLYQGDGSHPSFEGTHLAAISIYQTIFQKKIGANCFTGTLTSENHEIIARNSQRILFDSLDVWNHDTCKVPVKFEYSTKSIGDTLRLWAQAKIIDPRADYTWYLNDNKSYKHLVSNTRIDSITVPKNAKITLKVRNACGLDSSILVFTELNTKTIQKAKVLKTVILSDLKHFTIDYGQKIQSIQILDQFSKLIQTTNLNTTETKTQLNVSYLKPGIYFVIVNNQLHLRIMVI